MEIKETQVRGSIKFFEFIKKISVPEIFMCNFIDKLFEMR